MTKTIVDFTQWTTDLATITKPFDDQLCAIAARDGAHQTEIARRGGVQTSERMEESRQAADRVQKHRAEAVARALAPRLAQLAAEHAKRIRETVEPARRAADAHAALHTFEHEMNRFLAAMGLFRRVAVADPDMDQRTHDFETRARRLLDTPAVPARPAPRPPLDPLDFADLVAS
jgi:uncharacterized protein with GYD domain